MPRGSMSEDGSKALLRLAPGLVFLLFAAGGCDHDGGDHSAMRVNTPEQIVIEDNYASRSGSDAYDWYTRATVARMEIDGHDFLHGSFRVRAVDAAGHEVLNILYSSPDDFWYVGGSEFHDLRFTVPGVSGPWTISLDFDELTADLRVSLEDNLIPPEGMDRTIALGMTVDHSTGSVFAAGVFKGASGGSDMSTWKLRP